MLNVNIDMLSSGLGNKKFFNAGSWKFCLILSSVLKVNGSGSTTLILSYCFSGHRNEGGGHSCLTREDAG
jgi:hypothetical protein